MKSKSIDLENEWKMIYKVLEDLEDLGHDPAMVGSMLVTAISSWCHIHDMDETKFFQVGLELAESDDWAYPGASSKFYN